MQQAEDDGAGEAEDEHEESLRGEPFADLLVSMMEGEVEALALGQGKEGEEEAIGFVAFEHEIDAEKGGGEDVEDVGEPLGQGGDEVSGGGAGGGFCALGDGFEAEMAGEGQALEALDGLWNALGQVDGELMEVVYDGWDSHGEEEAENGGDGDDQDGDGEWAREVKCTDAPGSDAVDGGREDDGKESGDVDDEEFPENGVGNRKKYRDAKTEENMAADGAGRSGLGELGIFLKVDQRGAPSRLSEFDAADVLRH